MANLKLRNLNKTYSNGAEVVKNFSLDIEDKEFVVLLGPSGCGKSIVLRMIAGLEEIGLGEVWIEDQLVNDVDTKDRKIAMLFQNYVLYPQMTVYENMAFSLRLEKLSKGEIDKLVYDTAKLLCIEELLERKPKTLSSAQKQRVAIGRAIIRNPKVFLMDEPLSNLDKKMHGQMYMEISKLHKKLGTTVVYVTHNQAEALSLGTKIVVMKEGSVQQVGSKEELYNNPKNLFVASYVGSPQMNFIEATVQKDGDEVKLVFGSNKVQLPLEKSSILLKKGYEGKDIILGIRPEDIKEEIAFAEQAKDDVLEATVKVVKVLETEVFLQLLLEENEILVLTNLQTDVKEDESIHITFDTSRIHIFDKDTEQAIVN